MDPLRFYLAGSLLGALALAIVLFGCGRTVEEAPEPTGPPARLLAELEAWRAIGGKIDIADLTPTPPPGARNAADLYRPLIDTHVSPDIPDLDVLHEPWDSHPAALARIIEDFEDVLDRVHEGTRLPYCDWGVKPEEEGIRKHLGWSRFVVRLLQGEAALRARRGDAEGAVYSLESAFLLSEQVAMEPTLLGTLVHHALDDLLIGACRTIFTESDAPLDRLERRLAARDYHANLRRVVTGETTLGIHLARVDAGGDPTRSITEEPIADDIAEGMVWYLGIMRSFIDSLKTPYHMRTSPFEIPPLPAQARRHDAWMDDHLDRLSQATASLEARAIVARLAMQLRIHRDRHGEYPDPLHFETPTNPLTGQPIEYIRHRHGFTLRTPLLRIVPWDLGESGDVYEWDWPR